MIEVVVELAHVLETMHIVLPERREIWHLVREPEPEKPTVRDVRLNLTNRLTHESDTEQVLKEGHLNVDDRVDGRQVMIIRTLVPTSGWMN